MERWRQIESLFQEALQRDPAQREAFVREACQGDSDLRREVASLLANHHEAADFKPWAAAAAAQLIAGQASLVAGQRLGPYEIIKPIGAGGMGEVYKARDTRLKRDVAIKICAAQFSERFEREARAIASLNHPNICQLHDVGPNYLVMELVEGENLSGPLPMDTALNYARQIAEALEAAHEKGIVHRDLKPGNIKITPTGVVKVLDFGLAKAAEEPSAAGDPANAPTLTMSPTRAGVILGTAPYMSPEQARGAVVDKRADIWAFGCVLYEMLTGKRAFQGETTSDILAAVLKEEPDWSRIPAKAQPLLRRCFAKDPKHRLRDIGDAMPLLDSAPEPASTPRPWGWVVAAVLAIAFFVAGVSWWRATRPAPLHPLVRLTAELSPGTTIDMYRGGSQWAISPDGARLAVVVRDLTGGKYRLVTRRLEESEFATLPGTEGANAPFFSPDGQWIAFFADGKLKKVAVHGGAPATLCDAAAGVVPRGASWGDDGNIIAALNAEGILWRIPSSGGVPTRATELDKKNGETDQSSPQVLPGSQAVLFSSNVGGTSYDREIAVVSFRTGQRKTLHRGGSACYLPSGHLVYTDQNTLYAAPFDLNRLSVTGAPRPVLEDIQRVNPFGPARYDFSQNGTLVYVSSKGQFSWSIFWLDSAGKTKPLHSTPGFYFQPSFSPDGKRLAFVMGIALPGRDIWMKDLERDTMSRLTSVPGIAEVPVWAPDGKSMVFNAFGQPASGLYWIRTDGSGELQRLTDGKTRLIPSSFSPDGKRLAYFDFSGGYPQIWTAPVEGDSDHPRLGKAELFLRTRSFLGSPVYSPDGRWLAYSSDETGTNEVYVRPFPGPGGKWQISTGGGQYPTWSRNKQELFFLTLDRRIMVASYTVNRDSFAPGKPQLWSEKRLMYAPTTLYALAPDGKRFAVVLNADGTAAEENTFTHLTVMLNFVDELRRRVPSGGK